MKRKLVTLSIAASGLLVAACDSANPPTISAADIAAAQAQYNAVLAAPSTAALPAGGTASMAGYIGGATTGDVDGFIAEIGLDVNFGTGSITGTIDNINITDSNGNPEQMADGSLSVSGSTGGTGMTANATGNVSGVDSGLTGTSNVNMTLFGNFHDLSGTADSVEGTATGGGTGDFDFNNSSVTFYAN